MVGIQNPDSSGPLVTVCIVTYNRENVLLHSLRQLFKSTYLPSEVMIVDNGRSPDLGAKLRSFQLPIKLLQPERNLGCAGLNVAFSHASGKYIFCFDDDSFPDPNCIQCAVQVFEKDRTLGMIGFKMHDPETRLPWHDPWWNPDCSMARSTVYCPGCGLAFRRDSRLPTELCVPEIVSQAHELSMAAEILRLGYRIEFRPECVAYHPDTSKGYLGEKARNGARNQLRFLLRYANFCRLSLIFFSQLLQACRKKPNDAAFAFKYIRSVKRRPLPGRMVHQFRDVFLWHTHPRLHRFL